MTTLNLTAEALAAAAAINAEVCDDGTIRYYDDATCQYWTGPASHLESLHAFLRDDPCDGYSHWCSMVGHELSEDQDD